MRHAEVERFCLSLKGTTLVVQWGDSRVYKVGGKVFAVLSAASEKPQRLSFKVSEESFHILTHEPNIIQAPYFAKRQWVCLERLDALNSKDLKAYLTRAHALIAAGLPKKTRMELGLGEEGAPRSDHARQKKIVIPGRAERKRGEGKGTQVQKSARRRQATL